MVRTLAQLKRPLEASRRILSSWSLILDEGKLSGCLFLVMKTGVHLVSEWYCVLVLVVMNQIDS